LQQIDLAEQVAQIGNSELSYRVLGNAHEDVVTAFETYQKAVYRYVIKRDYPKEEAERMISKRAVGNRFQNVARAKDLYKSISIDPFSVLTPDELGLMQLSIEKRHVVGHNLSIADQAYSDTDERDKPGTTVAILADEVSDFAQTAKKVILELQRLM
jgi:hypothetical protein